VEKGGSTTLPNWPRMANDNEGTADSLMGHGRGREKARFDTREQHWLDTTRGNAKRLALSLFTVQN